MNNATQEMKLEMFAHTRAYGARPGVRPTRRTTVSVAGETLVIVRTTAGKTEMYRVEDGLEIYIGRMLPEQALGRGYCPHCGAELNALHVGDGEIKLEQ